MKKILLMTLVVSINVFGQVGVGTVSPNSSAAMDVDVSNLPINNKKGLLLPKVQLQNNTDITTVASPAVGLMVYNISNAAVGTPQAVEANTYYFWNGTQWTNLTSLTEVRRELLPQVFFLAQSPAQPTVSGTDNVNAAPVVVSFLPSSVVLNTGNNITLNADNTFKVNTSGTYEVSGFINYNPGISIGSTVSTNVEFIIQSASSTTGPWSNIAKTIGVWGAGTTANNKSNNIPPVTISVAEGTLLRCVVVKTEGANHSTSAQISSPTGLKYGKVLKIQKVD